MKKIVIVEDNKKIRDELCLFLSKNGYICEAPVNFSEIVDSILAANAQLVLLDINLPVYDGYYVCREIRKRSDIPIIVVTSRDSEFDELTAMSFGADDFITKPYNTQILLMRISSVLKRAYKETLSDRIDCGSFSFIPSKSVVEYMGSETELTKNELRILTCLYERKGSIVSRDELMTKLWNSEVFIDDNTLTVNMNRLRKKLEDIGVLDAIQTKRGQGYLLI
jgi:DNA-binding response OmpR family regulator